MQGSARKDVVFGAARVYAFTVPGPKWKSWLSRLLPGRKVGVSLLGFAKCRDEIGLRRSSARSQRGPANALVCKGTTCRALSSIPSFQPESATLSCEHP